MQVKVLKQLIKCQISYAKYRIRSAVVPNGDLENHCNRILCSNYSQIGRSSYLNNMLFRLLITSGVKHLSKSLSFLLLFFNNYSYLCRKLQIRKLEKRSI